MRKIIALLLFFHISIKIVAKPFHDGLNNDVSMDGIMRVNRK